MFTELKQLLAEVPVAVLLLLRPLASALDPQAKLNALPLVLAPPPPCGSPPVALPPQMIVPGLAA